MRRILLIAWAIIAFNGTVIAGRLSSEPIAIIFTVVRFLVAHPGRVSLADLQRNSGRAGNDFDIYQRLYGATAFRRLQQYIAADRRRGGDTPGPTDPQLQEIQDAQYWANDPRFRCCLPTLAMIWVAWAHICVALPWTVLRLVPRDSGGG